MSMFAIEVSKDIDARFERLSKKTGRPKAEYINEALIEYLDEMEDLALAEERLRENLPSISAQEMERRLGLED